MATLFSEALVTEVLLTIDGDSNGQDDWVACGSDIAPHLRDCILQIQMREVSSVLYEGLSDLLKKSHDAIKSAHHSKVERKWRRVYTDISILKGVLVLLDEEKNTQRHTAALDAIRDLDMAIIVCGAPGEGRSDMIHQEIALLQRGLPLSPLLEAKAQNEVQGVQVGQTFCLASQSITEVAGLPSLSVYFNSSHSTPFVVRNFAATWPALQMEGRKWADASYLARVGGPGRVVPVEIGWQYTESDWYQDIISWQDFLQAIGWTSQQDTIDSEKPKYLAQHNLFRQFPALESDIVIPDIVYSCPPAPPHFKDYRPPIDEDGLETTIINAWIGPKGTTTPAHFDPYYNAYIQVVGYKLVWVAPPDVFANPDTPLMDGNSSTLAVFEQEAKETAEGSRVLDKSMSTILAPGDLLVLPPGWFHAIRSLTRSFSVSMWY